MADKKRPPILLSLFMACMGSVGVFAILHPPPPGNSEPLGPAGQAFGWALVTMYYWIAVVVLIEYLVDKLKERQS